MANYDAEFFDYVNSGAVASARSLLPHLVDKLAVSSVLDVGCGQGAWLSVWSDLGVSDLCGVDGDYVERSKLLVDETRFQPHDLRQPLNLDRQFDLVQSLEVAEHLPSACADDFVDSLVCHSELVMFSAAPPGQGGDHHINEQPYEYWKQRFEARGYIAVDCLRPLIAGAADVEPWYRYNTVLYVARDRLGQLPETWRRQVVATGRNLPDLAPLSYRLRRRVVSVLPVTVATGIAKFKERLIARARHSGDTR